MADRRRNNDPWASLATIAGGLLAGAAVGYGIYRATQDNDEQGSSEASPETRHNVDYPEFKSVDLDPIIIAVDATETRAGGLLILPYTKEIYFYSIDWPSTFEFPNPSQPDKFEMVNALLALEIFEEYVREHREGGEQEADEDLVLKTDNTFSTSRLRAGAYPGQGNERYRELYQKITEKLKSEPFEGDWKHVTDADDVHVKMADKLSRGNYTDAKYLPEFEWSGSFDDYVQTNVSRSDKTALQRVAAQVPYELRR